ncbi:MAG TPA: protein kinase, partial [Pseudomonadota bacterium]|nr:protein kinase [Pseudomonadota bacterium]
MLGKVIGSYRVLRFLGEGGMGVVYEAVHQQLGRRAAIKVLHDEYAHEPEMVQRFVNEARALSIVGHPGLVSIYEVGQLESGAPYICMEFLDGETLLNRL